MFYLQSFADANIEWRNPIRLIGGKGGKILLSLSVRIEPSVQGYWYFIECFREHTTTGKSLCDWLSL